MSYEHFQTVMTADMMSPDGRRVIYACAGRGRPRWRDEPDGRGWVTAYLYAHDAIDIAADRVAEDVMAGISGDHPDKRGYIAAVLRAAAHAVRELAADAACDGALTEERWEAALARLRESTCPEDERDRHS